MSNALPLADVDTITDLRTFVSRARVVVPDGYVRLQAAGTTLMATVLVRTGSGLLGSGTVTGMRGVPLAARSTCDVLVDLSAVGDRLARMEAAGWTGLDLPPTLRQAPWASMTPPRSGWEVIGEFEDAEVATVAADGLARVTRRRDEGASEAELTDLDQQIWNASVGEEPGRFRSALALGMHALGFLGHGPVRYLRHGTWQRLSSPVGDVLGR